jgi:hypothetical protein
LARGTLQLAGEIDLGTVSRTLGHAEPAFTLKVYQHAIAEVQEDAAEKIANMIPLG